jgi:glycosyltransferase involved in cell wall biosynthesis
MARSLIELLRLQGHDVPIVSRLRSYDRDGDPLRQLRLRTLAAKLGHRLTRRMLRDGPPDLWLTYHCYHKAPDWLGPAVSRELGIPYVIAEPSLAGKQEHGPWATGHAGACAAFAQADLLLAMTRNDLEGLAPTVRPPAELRLFPPFVAAAPFAAAAAARNRHRQALAAAHGLDPTRPWLLCVAMMRADVKRLSYLALADALDRLRELPWRLVCIGDGAARAEIEARLAGLGADRVRCLGTLAEDRLPPWCAACDLMVWPAFREAYGVALLEAQAAGLPVVACREGGVPDVVVDGETGVLIADRDLRRFADAIASLLHDHGRRRRLATAAVRHVAHRHDVPAAALRLSRALADAGRIHAERRRKAA